MTESWSENCKVVVGCVCGIVVTLSLYVYGPDTYHFFHTAPVMAIIGATIPIFGWVGALAALGGLMFQMHRAQYTLEIDMLLKLSERFDRPEMLKTRARAARFLLYGNDEHEVFVDEAFDFFEEIGFLLKRKAIGPDAVWNFFYGWIIDYFEASAAYRAQQSEGEVELWSGFEYLYEAVQQVQLKKLRKQSKNAGKKPRAVPKRTADELQKSLELEADIGNQPRKISFPSRLSRRLLLTN